MIVRIGPKDKRYKIISRNPTEGTIEIETPEKETKKGFIRSISSNGKYEIEIIEE